MSWFRALLAGIGVAAVRTHIRSGNAVFESDLAPERLEPMIRDAVAKGCGFAPRTFVRTAGEIAEALADHPSAEADPARAHVFFRRKSPDPDAAALRALALPGDAWHVGSRRPTLYMPGGIGRSRLTQRLPRLPAAPMTPRNLRTVQALHDLAG